MKFHLYFAADGSAVQIQQMGRQAAGMHEWKFERNGLPAGVYFFKVKSERQASCGKIVLTN